MIIHKEMKVTEYYNQCKIYHSNYYVESTSFTPDPLRDIGRYFSSYLKDHCVPPLFSRYLEKDRIFYFTDDPGRVPTVSISPSSKEQSIVIYEHAHDYDDIIEIIVSNLGTVLESPLEKYLKSRGDPRYVYKLSMTITYDAFDQLFSSNLSYNPFRKSIN